MKKSLIFLFILLPLLFTSCKTVDISYDDEVPSKGYQTISMDDALVQMEDESDFILLDVRTQFEYDAGHIPGALHITNETMTEKEVNEELPDKEQRIYVYCRSGHRSVLACRKLTRWGYQDIINIGGILDYEGPVEK